MPRFLAVTNGKVKLGHDWPDGADWLWVDVGPGEDDWLEGIVRRLYPAHPLAIGQVLDSRVHKPRLVVEPEALVFGLSEFTRRPATLGVDHTAFLLGRRFLVTAHLTRDNPILDDVWDTARQLDIGGGGADLVLYHILREHVAQLSRIGTEVEDEFEEMHRKLLEKPNRDLSPGILRIRRDSLTVKKLIDPELETFQFLQTKGFPYVADRHRLYFQDVYLQMLQITRNIEAFREGLSGLVEAYSSMQSNEINKVMKFLTIISVLALPATTIASIYEIGRAHV